MKRHEQRNQSSSDRPPPVLEDALVLYGGGYVG